jgi:hypothetical protein
MSAQGMIILPSYTITKADASENVGNKPFAFKAFNREHIGDRTYVFAAEDEREMKTWMNVMSLASIAFGTGRASTRKEVRCACSSFLEASRLPSTSDMRLPRLAFHRIILRLAW